jgi:translation initiation factor 3 subunit L
MTIRHVTVKLKPQLSDHLASWANYKKLFELVAQAKEEDFFISAQWIYDITQEFAYQFQGFCQYRCQLGNLNPEVIKTLQNNRDAWNFPEVLMMLNRFMKLSGLKPSSTVHFNPNNVIHQFGYFSSIELARIQCLIGDYSSSLATLAHLKLNDRNEIFHFLPICHFNVFYHIGVCHLMLRHFNEGLDVFSDIILYVLRILKPGAASHFRQGVTQQLQRMVDKAMSLTAILMTVNPSYRMEESVKEAVEGKYAEKIRRLTMGERNSCVELFESSCPKFISPLVPDYGMPTNMHNDVFQHQSKVLVDEILQYVPFLKLRSLIAMYTSIDISKLARFSEMNQEMDLICLLLSYKNKAAQSHLREKLKSVRTGSDLNFCIDGGVLLIDSVQGKYDQLIARERHFISGVKKHAEIRAQLTKAFKKVGL